MRGARAARRRWDGSEDEQDGAMEGDGDDSPSWVGAAQAAAAAAADAWGEAPDELPDAAEGGTEEVGTSSRLGRGECRGFERRGRMPSFWLVAAT